MPSTNNPDELGWINKFLSLQANLSGHEIHCVLCFSLLWNLFEGLVCGRRFTKPKIDQEIRALHKRGNLRIAEYEGCRKYFIERYIENGRVNFLFSGLMWRANDKKVLVIDVLEGRETKECEVLLALLMIAFRYRNNLFHGEKSLGSLPGQNANFEIANRLLMMFLEQWRLPPAIR